MYISTRSNEKVKASVAIIKGLANDGGLYFPCDLSPIGFNEEWLNYDYKKIAFIIMKKFLDDFYDEEIIDIINKAYSCDNFKEEVTLRDFENVAFLGLYNGPTFAFKDMALTVLPLLMEASLKKNNNFKKTIILTATSGDTGSAAMAGFNKTESIRTITLYPNNGVSEFQEKQMHSYAANGSIAISVDGNFDDCQRIVKTIFNTYKGNEINLASANSINIGRLVPQIVYYFYSYVEAVRREKIKFKEKIDVVVPTGNFGNILACYLAKIIGAPIDKIICASNKNNVLTDFFETGVYDRNREFYKTSSPSMDILVSSNLERYLYLISNGNCSDVKKLMDELNEKGRYELPLYMKDNIKNFLAGYVSESETLEAIKDCFNKYGLLIDPHTAVAYKAYLKLKGDNYTVVASTASPFKFVNTYLDIFELEGKDDFEKILSLAKITNTDIDDRIMKLENVKVEKEVVSKEEAIEFIKNKVGIK